MIKNTQDVVFNRTGRADIPASHVRREAGSSSFHFRGLHHGAWSQNLSAEDLAVSVLYVDIHSLLLLRRNSICDVTSVFDAAWEGLRIDAPPELVGGDYRVTMQVTIALPSNHPEAGRILARSSEIILIEGPEGAGVRGASLLKVRPEFNEFFSDLSRLEITEADGPVLYVNAGIPGYSWKDLARDPKFKYSIFSNAIREILRYLVFNPECRGTWGAAWLSLEGVKGRDVPEVDDLGPRDAWIDVDNFASEACEGLLQHLQLASRFAQAATESEAS